MHRVRFLNAAIGKRRVLVVGDGDGRFTEQLAKAYPNLEIDCIEISAGMVTEAHKRVTAGARVRIIQADVLSFAFKNRRYDAVFTHFFLDCFGTGTVKTLVDRLSAVLGRRSVWIVSDFRQVDRGWRRMFTRVWIAMMYLFFRYATDLETSRLPEYRSALHTAGFILRNEHVSMGGLIASEWWQR